MTLPLVTQLRFARSSFMRILENLDPADAVRRLEPMNCISWMVGHMASQEQAYWVLIAQGKIIVPDLHRLVGTGYPASTPPLAEMVAAWQAITAAADEFLNKLTPEKALEHLEWKGKTHLESIGTLLLRTTYHYWFHTGEAHAVRQMLGHQDLPEYISDMSAAVYRREID